jgi:hypothetical protein
MSFWHVENFEAVALPYCTACRRDLLPKAATKSVDGLKFDNRWNSRKDRLCFNGDGTDQAAAVPIKVMRRNARMALIFCRCFPGYIAKFRGLGHLRPLRSNGFGCGQNTRSDDAEAGLIHSRISTGTSGSYV